MLQWKYADTTIRCGKATDVFRIACSDHSRVELKSRRHDERIDGVGGRELVSCEQVSRLLSNLSIQFGHSDARAIEQMVLDKKGIYANVDFYSASCLHIIGVPTDQFTPIFAASRVTGWSAHVMEQLADNRIIRPRAEYVGPLNKKAKPLSER